MDQSRPAGWYHLDARTIRYWNGDRWVGDPKTVPEPSGRFLPPDRRSSNRNWWGIFLLVLVGISLLGGVLENLERRSTDLGDGLDGTQQEWVDYFDSADASIELINDQLSGSATTMSLSQIVAALKELSNSPEEALNRSAMAAVEACESDDALRCAQSLDRLADAYNAALSSAEKQGLLEITDE